MLGLGTAIALYHLDEQIKPRYREGIEDTLVETANTLAALVSESKDEEAAFRALLGAQQRVLDAQIYKVKKTTIELRVYVTDERGIVRFHSYDSKIVGSDYSKWRDVALTLQGKYGARTTRDDPLDPDSTVLYIGAPIMKNGKMVGVLSVGKPQRTVHLFISRTKNTIVTESLLGAVFLLMVGWIISLAISRPIGDLRAYANQVAAGGDPKLPNSYIEEVHGLGKAFALMRESLEGKKYIERYIQNLTHELKSPTTAIRGAAELLLEDLQATDRSRFTRNILVESKRLEEILSRLLELESLGHRTEIHREQISLSAVIKDVIESCAVLAQEKGISIAVKEEISCTIEGDSLLLRQALINLLTNAVEFSSNGQSVKISSRFQDENLLIDVSDEGVGIPDYALNRVGERFFSLPRPDTGKKGTGLGVAFTRRVAELHGGTLSYCSNKPSGTIATFALSSAYVLL